MSFNDRLKQLTQQLREAPMPPKNMPLPDGPYQVKIIKAALSQAKGGLYKDQAVVDFQMSVLIGKFKGRRCWRQFGLEAPAFKNENWSFPSGMSQFKGALEVLGVPEKTINNLNLEPKHLDPVLGKLIGQALEVTAKTNKKGYTNIWFNRALGNLNVADEELEPDDDFNEVPEIVTPSPVLDDSDEDMDLAPEAPPVPKKRGRGRPKGSKNKPKVAPAPSPAPAPTPAADPAPVATVAVADDDDDFGDDWDEA